MTYTVSDGHGGTNTAVATFNIRDYIPGNISGVVWADVDNDAQIDLIDPPMGPERRLADVEVYITGTTIFEETFSDMVVTNEFGEYSFTGLVPGTYTISLKNPTPGSTLDTVELFIDGKDVADVDGDYVNDVDATNGFYETEDKSASVRRTGNNTFEVKFGEDGLDVSRLNFGMLGLQAKFVNIRDHLASSTSNGVVFGANKSLAADSQQYWFALYDGWDGMHSLRSRFRPTCARPSLTLRDASGVMRTVTLSRSPTTTPRFASWDAMATTSWSDWLVRCTTSSPRPIKRLQEASHWPPPASQACMPKAKGRIMRPPPTKCSARSLGVSRSPRQLEKQ